MTIGEKIKEHRKARGFTQKELAALANITRNYLAKVETNKSNIGLPTIEKIAKALEIDKNLILQGDSIEPVQISKDDTYEKKLLVLARQAGNKLSKEQKDVLYKSIEANIDLYMQAVGLKKDD